MNFSDPQAELVHHGIDGVIADTQDRIGIDGFKEKSE